MISFSMWWTFQAHICFQYSHMSSFFRTIGCQSFPSQSTEDLNVNDTKTVQIYAVLAFHSEYCLKKSNVMLYIISCHVPYSRMCVNVTHLNAQEFNVKESRIHLI